MSWRFIRTEDRRLPLEGDCGFLGSELLDEPDVSGYKVSCQYDRQLISRLSGVGDDVRTYVAWAHVEGQRSWWQRLVGKWSL